MSCSPSVERRRFVTSEGAAILDSSALLAFLHREPGEKAVRGVLRRAAMSSVNLSEVASKLIDRGMTAVQARRVLGRLPVRTYPFDDRAAMAAADLRSRVPRDVSLGDRACLALAAYLSGEAITADLAWARLGLSGVRVVLIR
jgi:ribonuclease VapC